MSAYLVLGAVVWLALHEAGVHPTLAGVALGLLAPSVPRLSRDYIDVEELADLSSPEAVRTTTDLAKGSVSVVEWLQHLLHPWTSYAIVPLFAFANAGIQLSGDGLREATTSRLAWAVFLGLVIGKPIGVVAAVNLSERTGLAERPEGSTSRQVLGVGTAAGIGFTVAIFITELAFSDPAKQADAKLAILLASAFAATVAALLLRFGRSRRRH
jgi:NhaA family Na+:H+ antiporter